MGAAVGLRHDAEAPGDLGIGVGQAAEVVAEDVLVELAAGLDVPQAARVGRDLVGDDQARLGIFIGSLVSAGLGIALLGSGQKNVAGGADVG